MINAKYIVIGILFTIIVGFSGCAGGAQGETTTGPQEGFMGGTDSLKLEIVGAPDKLIEGSDFSVAVKATNLGESDIMINDLTIRMGTASAKQWDLEKNDKGENIFPIKNDKIQLAAATRTPDGKVFYPGVFQTTIGKAKAPDVKADDTKSILIDACYSYSSKAILPICVSEIDVYGEGLCSPNGDVTPQNSASPLHVTSAIQNVVDTDSGKEFNVLVTIQAMSTLKGSCDAGAKSTDPLTLTITPTADWADTDSIKCDEDNKVTFSGSTYQFNCQLTTGPNPGEFIGDLTLEIGGYTHTVTGSKDVLIIYNPHAATTTGAATKGCVSKVGAELLGCEDIGEETVCKAFTVCAWDVNTCKRASGTDKKEWGADYVCKKASDEPKCTALSTTKCEWK